jgi:hypothetical protein
LMLHRALLSCGVRKRFFRFGKTADMLPTRIASTGGTSGQAAESLP